MAVKFYCNHCGKLLDNVDDYVDYDIEFDELSYTVDLCAKCKAKLVKGIDTILIRFVRGSVK